MESPEDKLECEDCGHQVVDEDTFCPYCGALFNDLIFCTTHANVEADGVCVICRRSFCQQCGSRIHKLSLCEADSKYEMYDGMAKVFGSMDYLQAEYAASCLEQAGLHPFDYSRVFRDNPAISLPSPTPFGDILNTVEAKILVPFDEVKRAEQVLIELQLIEQPHGSRTT